MSRRLIDANALTDDILKSAVMIDDRGIQTGYEIAIELIKRQPTIDAVPHWIPCSERLPEAPFGCLVTVEDEEPMTGALFPNLLPYFVGWDGEQWNDADGEQCPFEVLAWMPLPDPYEVENDEIH